MPGKPALQNGPGTGSSGPELLPARRKRVPLEFLLGGLALLVCAGAVLGPRVYRGVVAGRLVRSMGEHFSAGDYPAATRLMELGWPESEAALRRFAESLPMGAYLPGEHALASASPGLGFKLPVPPEPGRGAEEFSAAKVDCCLQFGGSFEGYFLGARPTVFAADGDRVEVSFVLDAPVARRLGLAAGETRRAVLTLKELRRAACGGSTVMADYDTKTAATIWKQLLDGLQPLLRGSGLPEPGGASQ
jgi:hypothetical protein